MGYLRPPPPPREPPPPPPREPLPENPDPRDEPPLPNDERELLLLLLLLRDTEDFCSDDERSYVVRLFPLFVSLFWRTLFLLLLLCVDCCTPFLWLGVVAFLTLFSVFVFWRLSLLLCTLTPDVLLRVRSTETPVRVLLGRLYTFSTLDALRVVRPDCAVAPLSTRVAPPALTPDDARAGPFARGT